MNSAANWSATAPCENFGDNPWLKLNLQGTKHENTYAQTTHLARLVKLAGNASSRSQLAGPGGSGTNRNYSRGCRTSNRVRFVKGGVHFRLGGSRGWRTDHPRL